MLENTLIKTFVGPPCSSKELYQPEHSELIILRPLKRDMKSLKKKVYSHFCPSPGGFILRMPFACVPVCQRARDYPGWVQWSTSQASWCFSRAILALMQEVPHLPISQFPGCKLGNNLRVLPLLVWSWQVTVVPYLNLSLPLRNTVPFNFLLPLELWQDPASPSRD